MYPFLWSLHSHRIFFENLSSNLATITRNLSVISSTLQKSFKIILMNWNNSCKSCYTKNWIFYLLNLQTGAFFGAKKRQHVRDILTKIKHFHFPHLIQITSSTSHSKKTMKIPWNCGVVFLILNWSLKILFNTKKKISSQHKYYRWKWALLLPFPHYTMKHSAVCI